LIYTICWGKRTKKISRMEKKNRKRNQRSERYNPSRIKTGKRGKTASWMRHWILIKEELDKGGQRFY